MSGEDNAMPKILITGCLGLVGSECVSFFEEKGWDVIGIDANMRSFFFGTEKQYSDKKNLFDIDIRDKVSTEDLFKSHTFDAVIHAAAQPSHDWAASDPITDFDINARGTLILLEAARKYCPDAVFVHVSTDKVYGENMQGEKLSDENLGLDFAGKRSLFGCSKAAADMYVQEYRNYFNMKTVCFRPGCITGRQHQGAEQHGFLAYVAKCGREGITYNIYGDGNAVRDQIHARDLANAFYHYIQNPKGDVYNIGGGPERAISVLDAVKTFNVQNYTFDNKRKGDRDYDIHDVSKFRRDYPEWSYTYSLKDIIDQLK